LDRLPSSEEGEIIRERLLIAKKREVSEAERERLRSMQVRFQPRSEAGDEFQPPPSPTHE
jgi:hypothetical protein